ncbi:galectin-9-like [Amblyomma americanum]
MDHPLEKLVPGTVNVPGTVIELAGRVLSSPKRFQINLMTGTGDIALHVNPRFDEGEVVFNTFHNGCWEREERVGRLPVQQECSFEATITVEEMGYKVAFNKHHFSDFSHRLHYFMVERIRADGCVTIHRFEQTQPRSYSPTMWMTLPCEPPVACKPLPGLVIPPYEPTIVCNPRASFSPTLLPFVQPTPFLYMLPGGRLQPGLTVQLSGRPLCDAKSFFVSFQCGGPGSDSAFHFSPRFHVKAVVCNSFQNGGWGTEERQCHSCFPFAPGVHFDLLIRVLDCGFVVSVNGNHCLQFQHRLHPLHRVSHLLVEGDVLLASCKFQHCK